mgnify:FL=1
MFTLAQEIDRYQPAITLEQLLSRPLMSRLRVIFLALTLGCGLLGVAAAFLGLPPLPSAPLFGAALIFGGLWLDQTLLFSYHNSYYFFGLNSIIGQSERTISGATYDVAAAIAPLSYDVSAAFARSNLGSVALLRTGLTMADVESFLANARPRITAEMVPLPTDRVFTLIDLAEYLIAQDRGLAALLKEHGITEDTYRGAVHWVIGAHHEEKRRARWWSMDNLSQTEGIGSELAYGTAYLLERYARDIRTSAVFSLLTRNAPFAAEKVADIESALTQAKAANVLIVGEAGVGKIDLVMEVARRLRTGKALAAISGKRIVVLDTTRLFATHRDKQELEYTLLSMFSEAVAAGNTVIVIENISTFIREAEAFGVYIPELIDPYLAHPELNLIATDTPSGYHTHLETLGGFVRRFAEVSIDTPDLSATTRVLQSIALDNEARYHTFFTYPALTAVTECADRYVVEGVMPDKAITLLVDVASRASQAGIGIITSDYEVVSEQTGIPAGPVAEEERDLLLNLEAKLHERVVGQQAALDAIARTMRRSRAGIQASDRPIGSFLFLGPTGVGKTETAKALAHVFFGNEQNMHRVDMSEFSGETALARLIGDGEHSGALADMLREHPYSVLLLDEFEKAAQSVHDLFLQILDEGTFTDSRGQRVNARNTIIIATSNAGAQLIMRTIHQRKELATLNQEIIDHIVREGIYRPELINRFDNTIIFEPLTREEQGQVAGLMLGGLYDRIKERGFELTVGRELMDLLVEKGYNPEYGARPMQRVLQDVVEEKVAQKIISGEAQKGDTIELSRSDFTEEELAVAGT